MVKIEDRNSKQTQVLNGPISKRVLNIRYLDFGIASNFGFRASIFNVNGLFGIHLRLQGHNDISRRKK